jgi:hypothetical protein
VVALLPGGDVRYDGQAAAFSVLLSDGSRLVDGRRALLLPGPPSVVLAAPGADPGIELLAEVADEVSRPLPVREGSSGQYRFFRWEPAGADLPLAQVTVEGARWESGVALVGYAQEGRAEPGSSIRWRLVYSPDGPPAHWSDLHWFNHLVDVEGRRWGQADGVGYPASEWQSGDLVAAWFDIMIGPDAPDPPYTCRVGMYSYPDIENVSLVDAAGNPTGQFLELGPIGP